MIKFTGDAGNFSDENTSSWVTRWILNQVKAGRYDCFIDADLTQALSNNELNGLISSQDTVVTFSPDTYEEMIQIIRTDLSVDDIHELRVKQIIYYDQKNNILNTRVVALAPLVFSQTSRELNVKQKRSQLFPLFWVKMDGKLPKKFKVKSSDINWAALVFPNNNPLDINSIKTVKNIDGFDIKNKIYQQAVEFEKPIVTSFAGEVQLTSEEISSMYYSIDTMVTFSPETYEEEIRITKNEINPEEVSNITLVQEWYFDKKRNRLMNRLKAICPMTKVLNRKGKLKYWRPFYFIKYE